LKATPNDNTGASKVNRAEIDPYVEYPCTATDDMDATGVKQIAIVLDTHEFVKQRALPKLADAVPSTAPKLTPVIVKLVPEAAVLYEVP